jgi:tetratricopeptide (TPR) repeat protein
MDVKVTRALAPLLLLVVAAGSCRRGGGQSAIQQAYASAAAGRPREAAQTLQAALQKTPDPAGFLLLGGLEERVLDWAEARRAFERAAADPATALFAHYGLARLAAKEEDWKAAWPHLQAMPKLHPNPVYQVLLGAPLVRTLDEAKAAAEKVAALRKQNPGFWADSAEVLATQADLQLVAGDRTGADVSLRALHAAAIKEVPSALLLADVYRIAGRLPPALALASGAVKAEPTSGDGWILLALIATQAREFAAADQALGRVAAKVPRDPELLMAKARVDRANERIAGAIESAQKAVNLVPASSGRYRRTVRLALVELLLQTNQSDRARIEVNAMLREDPTSVPAQLAAAAVAIEQKHLDEALKTLESLDATEDLSARTVCRVQELRGAAFLAKGETAGAEKAFRRCIEKRPTDATGPLLLGIALESRRDLAGARREWQRAMELAPGDAGIVRRLAELDWKAGHRNDAIELVRAQQKRVPQSPALAELLGQLLHSAGQMVEAEAQYRRALELAPGRSGTWLALAQLYRATGRHQDRLAALQKARAQLPPSLAIELEIADAERRTGHPEKAVAIYEKALEAQPGSPAVLNNLALVYAGALGKPERGLPLAEKAHAQLPADPRFTDTLGWIHHLSGNSREALPLLRRAAAATRFGDPDIDFHLGVALMKAGDSTGLGHLRKALSLSPNFEGADQARKLVDEKAPKK